MLKRYLVLEEPHVIVITLKAMLHDEEMHADKGCLRILVWVIFVGLHDLGLADLVRALYFLNECWVCVHAIALLKDDRVYLRK